MCRARAETEEQVLASQYELEVAGVRYEAEASLRPNVRSESRTDEGCSALNRLADLA